MYYMLNERYTILVYTCIYSIYLNTHYIHVDVLILEYLIYTVNIIYI